MEALVKTLSEKGIRWLGVRLTPSSLALLEELARRTSSRANEPVRLKREYLCSHSGRGLSETALSDSLKQLMALRLIRRERRKPPAGHWPANGKPKEEVALTWVSPVLIAVAETYRAQRRALRASGKRGHAAYPSPIEIELPLPEPFGTFPPPENGPDPGLPMAITVQSENTPIADATPLEANIHAGFQGLSSRIPVTASHRKSGGLYSHPPTAEASDMPSETPTGFAVGIAAGPLGRQAHITPAPAGRGGVGGPSGNRLLEGEAALEERVRSARRLAYWIQIQNGGNRDHLTRLVTIRCGADGRYAGGELALGKHSANAQSESVRGGLTLTEWDGLYKMVHARNAKTANSRRNGFTGESIFAGPLDGSRIILLDDVKSPTPLIEGAACAILETSRGNFQHLYVADRDLTNQERHTVTCWLRERLGGISDPGALSGHQAYRWPGSVNLKPGRRKFWTRLTYLESGKSIAVEEALGRSLPSVQEKKAAGTLRVPNQAGGADKSASGQDWGRAIRMLEGGRSAADVEAFLSSSALGRGKGQAYVDTTMANLTERGFLPGA